MRWSYALPACLALLGLPQLFAQGQVSSTNPLRLQEVLDSVERNYPPLLATLFELDIADAAVLEALGGFDLRLTAASDTNRIGFYENQGLQFGFDQPFAGGGRSIYGGWRQGSGTYPSYEGLRDTRSLGEWSGGIRIPLLRNREIDQRRATLARTQFGQDLAELTVDQQRLIIRQFASQSYWDWVAAGQRLRVAEDLLTVAEERDQQLREAADLGQIPTIEVTENQRQILQRQAQRIEAQRGVQQTAFLLSLFYRDANGNPLVPTQDQLPPALPETYELTDEQLSIDLAFALDNRPDVLQYEPIRQQTTVDYKLAENMRRPAVDLGLGVTSEAGTGSVLRGPNQFKASLSFDLPFQRRTATGKMAAAEARLNQISRRQQFALDQVSTQVRDAASALSLAHNRALLAEQEVQVALDLADAERVRFDLGDSTLFTVNLRELAAVEAELREIAAINDFLRALTLYEQATAGMLRNP